MKPLFVAGIGTGVGKTLISAILVEKLGADYWKPIQSGDLPNSDTLNVQALVTHPAAVFHPEAYRLTQPFSPHKSAALDGVQIDPAAIQLPVTSNRLVIEGAGGLLVPVNDHTVFIDLIARFSAEVILVSMNYLGSINHTLLSAEALKQRGLPVKGIVFNGPEDPYSEKFILAYTGFRLMGRIPQLDQVRLPELTGLIDL